MKKDVLKEFVADNRASFDEKEPSPDMLRRIQSQLGMQQPVPATKATVVSFRYGWAAAAAIVLVIATILFFQTDKKDNQALVAKPKKENPFVASPIKKQDVAIAKPTVTRTENKKPARKIRHQTPDKQNAVPQIDTSAQMLASNSTDNLDWRKNLDNTQSSSVRLAAVLASGKQDDLSVSDLQALANTMNNDGSSNVRLAALDVLSKQRNQSGVKTLILQSLAKQDDPIVQMELLSMLSPDESATVKKQLLDITQNPMNIDAVRNQAYAALLRSKTNF